MTGEAIHVILKCLASKAALVEHLRAGGNPLLVGAAAESPKLLVEKCEGRNRNRHGCERPWNSSFLGAACGMEWSWS